MATNEKLSAQKSFHTTWAQKPTQAANRNPASEMVKPAPGPVNIVTHFPPLPITKPMVTREASPAPSYVSSNSEESVCSTRPGRILTLNETLRFYKDFQITLTLQKATTCFKYCDDRKNNVETELFAGMEVVVKDVLEFPELGQNWYNIVDPFFGWIDGEALRKERKVVQKPRRKVKSVARVVSEAEKFPFAFGESVKCLVKGAWKVGTIRTTARPVKIQFNGESIETIVDVSNIKKIEAKQTYTVIVKDLPVRTEPDVRSFALAHLKEGTKIQIVEFRGQFAKLNNPVGWIRCKTDLLLSVLESQYVPENVLPTLRITNIPEDSHAKSVFECLETQLGEKALPFLFAGVRINFTASRNGKKNAELVFPQRFKAVIILEHSAQQGFILGGERLDMAFSFPYLRKYSCPKNWRPETEI